MQVDKSATNVSVMFYITEDVGGTNPGEAKTGLLFSNLTSASYARAGAARVAITPITLGSAAAAHADGGFLEIDATNMAGLYRFDIPDAAVVTGVDIAVVSLLIAGASNAVASPLLIDLVTPMRGTESAALASVLGASVGADISADIAAVKSTADAIPTTAMRGTDGANTVAPNNTGITTIINDLANGTDGLGALLTAIQVTSTDLANGTDGLGALKTAIEVTSTDLANGTDGLGALLTAINLRMLATHITAAGGIASADTKKMNGTTVIGTGIVSDKWRA